jgi:hypothetical protein
MHNLRNIIYIVMIKDWDNSGMVNPAIWDPEAAGCRVQGQYKQS